MTGINLLSMGASWLQDRMEESAGIQVMYQRAGQPAFPLKVVPGRNPVEITDQNGVVLRGQVFDFTVRASNLLARLQGGVQRPARGDEITAVIGSFKVTFVVTGEDFSTSHYESADSYGVSWRIHTKSDRVENAS